MTSSPARFALRRFEATAPVSGPPVLLIHGFGSDGYTDWVEPGWPTSLTSAGRTVLVPDMPAHGESVAPQDSTAALPSTIITDLTELVAAETAGTVEVIGYSMGARLAWDLAQASGIDVAHLVLGGISPGEPFAAADTARILACAERGETPEDPLTGAVVGMVTGDGKNTRGLVSCVAGLGSEPFAPQQAQPQVPTLLVAGEDDAMTEGIADLAALVAGAPLQYVPGDHMAALHSSQFRKLATEFIGA